MRWSFVDWYLGDLPFICPGYTFDVMPRLPRRSHFRKRTYKIVEILEENQEDASGKFTLWKDTSLENSLPIFTSSCQESSDSIVCLKVLHLSQGYERPQLTWTDFHS